MHLRYPPDDEIANFRIVSPANGADRYKFVDAVDRAGERCHHVLVFHESTMTTGISCW